MYNMSLFLTINIWIPDTIHLLLLSYRSMRIRQVLKSVRAFHMSDNTDAYEMEFTHRAGEGRRAGDLITVSYLANSTSYYPRTASYRHRVVRDNRPHEFIEVGG